MKRKVLAILVGAVMAASLGPAEAASAIDRYQAAGYFNSLSHDDCGNGSTWVCFVRYDSNCMWIAHNYFFCDRYWTETQFGIHNQNQRGHGHLQPYPPVPGAWTSPDYRVQNVS
jgi:hypothetical protein